MQQTLFLARQIQFILIVYISQYMLNRQSDPTDVCTELTIESQPLACSERSDSQGKIGAFNTRSPAQSLRLRWTDADVAEPDVFAVVLQAEIAAELASFEVGEFVFGRVHDNDAVVHDAICCAAAVDFERVPLASGAADVLFRRRDGVDAAGKLVGLQVFVAVGGVVEDLNFGAGRCVRASLVGTVEWHAAVHAGVAAGFQFVFEPQVEVAELVLAAQPRTFLARADQRTVFNLPALRRVVAAALPAGEVVAVEE